MKKFALLFVFPFILSTAHQGRAYSHLTRADSIRSGIYKTALIITTGLTAVQTFVFIYSAVGNRVLSSEMQGANEKALAESINRKSIASPFLSAAAFIASCGLMYHAMDDQRFMVMHKKARMVHLLEIFIFADMVSLLGLQAATGSQIISLQGMSGAQQSSTLANVTYPCWIAQMALTSTTTAISAGLPVLGCMLAKYPPQMIATIDFPGPGDLHGGHVETPGPGDIHGGHVETPGPGDIHGHHIETPGPGDIHGGAHDLPGPPDLHGAGRTDL